MLRSIKSKIIALIAGTSIALSLLLAFYSPQQARSIGSEILYSEAEFVTRLLVQGLAADMQANLQGDHDAALKRTLDMLRAESSHGTITDMWIYSPDGNVLVGLNKSPGSNRRSVAPTKLLVTDDDDLVRASAPILDADAQPLGYLEIDFSKQLLHEKVAVSAAYSMLIALLIIAGMVVIGFLFGRYIGSRIEHIARIAEGISTGDIDQTVEIDSNDEIGLLATAFKKLIGYIEELARAAERIAANDLTVTIVPKSEKDVLGNSFLTMAHNLTGIVNQLQVSVTDLGGMAGEISSSAERMANGAREQTDQVSQVSAAVEQMAATIAESSKNASNVTEASQGASETATLGGEVVSEAIQGMQRINQVVRDSAESITRLARSTDDIGDIVKVIDDIADQTNLLALNAAIEAARAGEQGRGFAVVADEVRKLAERTGKATAEITAMIKGIQIQTGEAVQTMKAGIEEVDRGRDLTDKAGNSLNEIVTMSQRVMDMIRQIAAASEEQAAAADESSRNIVSVSSIAGETASGAEQSAAAARRLNQQADGLHQMVSVFRVNQDD